MQNTFQVQVGKINDIKKGYESPLVGIIKYIQDEDSFINETFFGSNKIITQDIIDEKISEFDEIISEIKKNKKDILLLNLQEVEKKFLINSLNQTGLKYILFKSAIYLEAEKLGFELHIKERQKYLKNVNKLQDIVYGQEISSIQSEKDAVLNSLKDLFISNQDKLSLEEKEKFGDFLSGFGVNLNSLENNTKKETCKNKLSETFVSKETFEKIFEIILDIYDLEGWSISIEKVGNFSVKKEKKQIICPESKIETTHLKRLFQLIDHEIGVHAIRGYNTDKTLKTSGEGYLEAEEGFATLSELMFDNYLDEISVSPTIHHITTFLAENFDAENTQKLLEIHYKLTGLSCERSKNESKDRTFRIKRFVSFFDKGANRKDVTYTRGQKQVVDFLQSSSSEDIGKFIDDFYFSKLSFEDIKLVSDFRESLGIDEKELRYPLWIGKILYKKLLGEKIFLKSLQTDDFRFGSVEKLSFSTKRKVIQILQLVS